MEDLKYPIGQVNIPTEITSKNISNWINDIENFPNNLEKASLKINRKATQHTLQKRWLDS